MEKKLWFVKETIENLTPLMIRETDNSSVFIVESCFKKDIPKGSNIQIPHEQLISYDRAMYILKLHVGSLLNFMEDLPIEYKL